MDHQEYFIINGENYQITIIDSSIVQLNITKKVLKTIKSDEKIYFNYNLNFIHGNSLLD